MPHFWAWGCAPGGGLWPQSRTRPRLWYNAPTPSFALSCVYSFGSYRVDKQANTQTNKQTLLKASNVTTLSRWVTISQPSLTSVWN